MKDLLQAEFARRQQRNPRYSLRAFARDLATHHASLSQVLRGRRHLSSKMMTRLGRRAGLSAVDVSALSEARLDALVLGAISSPSFRPASRWIAIHTGVPLDAVNCSLVRLLQRGLVTMESPQRWRSFT
jgi:hypothetical protein